MATITLSIHQLQKKWEKEKEYYRHQEVGSGVQKFVKDVLRCSEIFNLNEGRLATPQMKRKNEFLEEYITKGKRQVDILIFITPEINIPVEVEQFTKIDRGIKQLFSYQTDLDQKYGILTDGYTWRFFNNNVYRNFNINQLFKRPELFNEFWKDYTLTDKYYISYFEPQGQLSLFKETEILSVEKNIEVFFQDITMLIRSIANKLQIQGYINGTNEKEREERAVQITYAYIIQFILYKTLVDNDFGQFRKEYEEFVNIIHNHIKNKTYKYILAFLDQISLTISQNIYRPFSEEQKFISRKLSELLHSLENKITDIAPWLDLFIFIKKYSFSNIQNEIFGYIYENYLKDLFEEEKKGQYFTDPKVVNFMIKQIGYTSECIKKTIMEGEEDKVSIIDPAAGSGTFIYSAVDQIINSFSPNIEENSKKIENVVTKNVFGVDIEEFPLYLAEMNILMRMLPFIIGEKYNNPVEKKINVFLTKDSIAEFIGTGIESGAQFELRAQEPEYDSFLRNKEDLREMKDSLEKQGQIPRRRFDYVIGNPPYIPYNECSKQNLLIFKWIKEKKVKLNNIYGVNLHSTPDNPKRYRPNPNLYTFFIALGLALLKNNGKLCYIIPQTVLVNPDFDVIRYHLSNFTRIEKIITFKSKMFIGRGIKQNRPVPTSSLIFVVKKQKSDPSDKVEVINYKHANDNIEETLQNIMNNKNIDKKFIPQKDFKDNILNWNFIKLDAPVLDFYRTYLENNENIGIYYDHKLAEIYFKSKFYFDGGYSIDEKKLLEKSIQGILNYKCPKLDDNFWTIKSFIGYWPDIRDYSEEMSIKLRQGNQQYNFLDSRYKVIWSYNNTSKFFFTDIPVIWARNKLLGIGSNNRKELLYIFSLLNSKITKVFLNNLIKLEHEETRTILVSLQIIKDQIRVPKINLENVYLKNAIIDLADELVSIEDKTLSNYVDLSRLLIQKFQEIRVEGNYLFLKHNGQQIKIKIKVDPLLVKKEIERHIGNRELSFEDQYLFLTDIKNLPIIDFERQGELKEHIDNLVFALYFNIPLTKTDLDEFNSIKKICKRNQLYELINSL
jgi:hypothetical protein